MDKTVFVIICGESCSGKDSVMNILVNEYGYHKMVSYTTRPKREGEIEGVDYFFLDSNEEFNKLLEQGVLFEKTEYQTNMNLWLYGLGVNSIKENCINALILNPHGISQIKDLPQFKNHKIFYITADTMTRIKRYLNRDNVDDKHKIELIDRLLRDDKDFNSDEFNQLLAEPISSDDWNSKQIAEIIYEVMLSLCEVDNE